MRKRIVLKNIGFLVICFLMVLSLSVKAEDIGEQLFIQNCMVCHADDGGGAMPGVSDLTESHSWSTLPESQLLGRLKAGVLKPESSVSMPPKGGNSELTDDDLIKIIKFMKSEFLK